MRVLNRINSFAKVAICCFALNAAASDVFDDDQESPRETDIANNNESQDAEEKEGFFTSLLDYIFFDFPIVVDQQGLEMLHYKLEASSNR